MEIIEIRKQFKENTEYVKNTIKNHGKLTYYIYESLYSLAHTMYANEYVGYCEIYDFLELLQEVEVNESKQQLANQIKNNIEHFKDECMRKLYEKHQSQITNSTINHINKLTKKAEKNIPITFQEYEIYIENFKKTLPMRIKEINYDYWKDLLIWIMPRCRTNKEVDKTERIKKKLISKVREVSNYDQTKK